jgi:hypothetical protein
MAQHLCSASSLLTAAGVCHLPAGAVAAPACAAPAEGPAAQPGGSAALAWTPRLPAVPARTVELPGLCGLGA